MNSTRLDSTRLDSTRLDSTCRLLRGACNVVRIVLVMFR